MGWGVGWGAGGHTALQAGPVQLELCPAAAAAARLLHQAWRMQPAGPALLLVHSAAVSSTLRPRHPPQHGAARTSPGWLHMALLGVMKLDCS